ARRGRWRRRRRRGAVAPDDQQCSVWVRPHLQTEGTQYFVQDSAGHRGLGFARDPHLRLDLVSAEHNVQMEGSKLLKGMRERASCKLIRVVALCKSCRASYQQP